MTMPHLMNCDHSSDGWCLECVKKMHDEMEQAGWFKLVRTGRVRSIASNEFSVQYPDGHVGVVWSPFWHDLSEDLEEIEAMKFAESLYESGRHKEKSAANTPRK